ncbi:uncharacterized protein BDZ99DRAFT_75398 [Mytilinidion resinicola]|uniref:Uncharacterized protein n=1 Tax=Mytilinidion resinicola TaxID=574789 RepID=A0A6A6YGZ2_9PEZI|nr:uncharacterized protein BDZ99DRAFT_75398 [Mytilinidion resinicola]KAF2807167.1 hypothetical protein BDZ99DRAFT_75398 [Mytilinidion resinicola]
MPFDSKFIFQAKGAEAGAIIDDCINQQSHSPTEHYTIFACILNNVRSDITARWSAAASILAFIRTILGLMSNSLDEIQTISYHSPILAVLLSLSSITAFSSRLDFKSPESQFHRKRDVHALRRAIHGHFKLWLQNERMQFTCFCVVLVCLSAVLWYMLVDVTRYGVVVFAIPLKANVPLGAGLTQLLGCVTIALRPLLFETRRIKVPKLSQSFRGAISDPHDSENIELVTHRPDFSGPSELNSAPQYPNSGRELQDVTVILRSAKQTPTASLIKACSLSPPSDCLRTARLSWPASLCTPRQMLCV